MWIFKFVFPWTLVTMSRLPHIFLFANRSSLSWWGGEWKRRRGEGLGKRNRTQLKSLLFTDCVYSMPGTVWTLDTQLRTNQSRNFNHFPLRWSRMLKRNALRHFTREAPKVKEHTKHSQCLASRVIRCSLDPPGKDKDLPRDWRCHPCKHWLTCSCERRLLQSRDALPMVSIPAECLPSPDSVGMGVVNKAHVQCGQRRAARTASGASAAGMDGSTGHWELLGQVYHQVRPARKHRTLRTAGTSVSSGEASPEQTSRGLRSQGTGSSQEQQWGPVLSSSGHKHASRLLLTCIHDASFPTLNSVLKVSKWNGSEGKAFATQAWPPVPDPWSPT